MTDASHEDSARTPASEFAMPKTYDPNQTEARWYPVWEDRGYFTAETGTGREPFVITIPPPNVTGSLHMGHAVQHAVHDLLVRWRRMQGRATLCVPGTDHAGIPTQMLVERELQEEGISRYDLGREKFLERMWEWRARSGGQILKQLRTMGCSYDWDRERFTLDGGYAEAVLTVFVHFYRKGWIYRGRRVINWCPRCRTALSDLEVDHEDQPSHLWHLKYPTQDGKTAVVVATTRPETMLGDTAVAVHPGDERYRDLVGRTLMLPLMNRAIPVVADYHVDPQFGSGAVKVTPAHDPNDFEIGQRHDLEQIVVIGEDGVMTPAAGVYAGLDRYEARKAVLRDLENQGLLVQVEDHAHAVGACARCGTTIEPLLSEQWFLQMRELADGALAALREGRYRYVPDRFTRLAEEWLENIRDWCLSRQIWWGHRVPVYTCQDCGHIMVDVKAPLRCQRCSAAHIEQDPDVLDTWFSSALWPYAVLGWPADTPELKEFYPTSVLITGRDILHLWVARMVMTSLEFIGEVPFRDVYVHPTVLTKDGRRMSKSLGTGIDPLELTDRYGADATRFCLIQQCSTTQDVRFDAEVKDNRVERSGAAEMGRNFATKLWNAARFVLMNLDGFDGAADPQPANLDTVDRWILSRRERAVQAVTEALEDYHLDVAQRQVYEFLWNEFCDWYVEMVKPRLQTGGEKRRIAQWVLWSTLERTLRLLHPFMPFITEDIWQRLPHPESDELGSGDSIMVRKWPTADVSQFDDAAEAAMDTCMQVVRGLRNLRAELGVDPHRRINASASAGGSAGAVIAALKPHIESLSRADLEILAASSERPARALSVLAADTEIYVPFGDLVDVNREVERLNKEISALAIEVGRSRKKLANPRFVERAPADIVQKERDKVAEMEAAVSRLTDRLARFSAAG